jgi:hypothetical protein
MRDAAAILGEINIMYHELFELELGISKINREGLMELSNRVEVSELVEIDPQIRRDEIMALIMQLTHEYIQITSHKT